MSKTKFALFASVAVVIIAPLWQFIKFEGCLGALLEENPDLDPAVVRIIYKEMYWDALTGKLNHLEDDADGSTGAFNAHLRHRYAELTSPY